MTSGRSREFSNHDVKVAVNRGSLHVLKGETGAIAIDTRYLPLIVSCFVGDVTLPLGMWFEETTRNLVLGLDGSRVINVHDATNTTRTSPEMRKFWADLSTRNSETLGAQTLHNFIVVTNPISRGVVTAISWLNPRVSQIQVFPNLKRAIVEAVHRLDAVGTPVALPSHGFAYADEVTTLIRSAPR